MLICDFTEYFCTALTCSPMFLFEFSYRTFSYQESQNLCFLFCERTYHFLGNLLILLLLCEHDRGTVHLAAEQSVASNYKYRYTLLSNNRELSYCVFSGTACGTYHTLIYFFLPMYPKSNHKPMNEIDIMS